MKTKIWCMVTSIRNGQLANKSVIRQTKQKNCEALLGILWDEGFIWGYKICKFDSKFIEIYLKYNNKLPAIKTIKSISKPSLKVYYSLKQIWKINLNQDLLILSTNKGILSLDMCKKLKVGGEPIIIIR